MTSVRSCPVCDQQEARFLFQPKESPGPVSKCLHCGMVYVSTVADSHALIFDGPVTSDQADPRILTSSDLADVRDSWEFSNLPDKELEWPALQQNALDALHTIETHTGSARAERTILDFGSGWGFFLAVAKERGWNTYGLEPLPASAVYARATFGVSITTDTLRENTFPPDTFDAITSFQVFEHLPYPQKDVRHLHKMLRRDGIIMIEVPNFETWTMRIMKSRHRHFVQDHLNFFSAQTLGRMLTENGFEVIDSYYPTRHMSVRHLVNHWFSRYLPGSLANKLQGLLERRSIRERVIDLNIGDIVAVLARKR